MDSNDACCKAAKKESAFDELLRELAGEVDVVLFNTDVYKNKVNKLDVFYLKCENELKCEAECTPKKVEPDTVFYKLRIIIDQLRTSNIKNDEIIQHLSTLL